jgi:hypothetical protein
MHLPPLAYLPQVLDQIDEMIVILRRSLGPASNFRRERQSQGNDAELSVLLLALNALVAARALRKLAAVESGNAVMPHARTLFEVLVKIRWMRLDLQRSTNYLTSEPFERFSLATPRVRASDIWPNIIRDCDAEFAAVPSLAQLPGAVNSDGSPNYKRVADGLRMPDLRTMSRAIGMDDEDYLLGQTITSLTPHSGIIHLRNFLKRNNPDGTVLLSEESDPVMLLSYVSGALPRIGQIAQEVLITFPDGRIQFDAENLAERVGHLVSQLRQQFGPPLPAP